MKIKQSHSVPGKEWTWNHETGESGTFKSHDGVHTYEGCLTWFRQMYPGWAGEAVNQQSFDDFLKNGPAVEGAPQEVLGELRELITQKRESKTSVTPARTYTNPSIEISDEPKLAPKNYRELKGFVRVGIKTYAESCAGVPLREASRYFDSYKTECGACGSVNTLCIYANPWRDLTGTDDEYELVCKDCGKFTQYHYSH